MCNIDVPGLKDWDTPKGWICPKCERVYAPFVSECLKCNQEVQSESKSSDTLFTEQFGGASSDFFKTYIPPIEPTRTASITSGTSGSYTFIEADGRKIKLLLGE
jgi:hypothetical protein